MSEKPTKVPRLNTHARDWYDYANQLERELAEVTGQRDELLDALDKLLDKVTDIRGIDMEAYAAEEIAAAEHVIKKIKEKIL